MSTSPNTASDGGRLSHHEEQSLTADQVREKVAADVPYGLTVAAAWSWRVLLVMALAATAIWLFSHISILVIPLIVAALLATLLHPLHVRLLRWRVPGPLSVVLCMLLLIGSVGGLLTLAGQQLAAGFTDMRGKVTEGIQGIIALAENYGLTVDEWDVVLRDITEAVRNNSDVIITGALGFGSTAGNIATGTVLALFSLIFFLLNGGQIWGFLLKFVPSRHRRAIDGAGRSGWRSLGSYVRVQIFVAFVDAVGIGAGAWILGVPLAMPLGVLVFLGSFIPIVGAVLTGAIAVLLALVANGLVNAIVMLIVVLVVQQVESNVLQPLVMGRAVSLHPLAVFLAVAGGTALLGLVGAVFAVPVMAFVNATVKYLRATPWAQHTGNADPNQELTFKERAAALEDRFLPLRRRNKHSDPADQADNTEADITPSSPNTPGAHS